MRNYCTKRERRRWGAVLKEREEENG